MKNIILHIVLLLLDRKERVGVVVPSTQKTIFERTGSYIYKDIYIYKLLF